MGRRMTMGKTYGSARTGGLVYSPYLGSSMQNLWQDPVIFFETKDLVSTRDWKAVPAALDRNQPTTKFGQGLLDRSENPLTDRSSGIGPMHGIEP